MDAEENIDIHSSNSNVRLANPPGPFVRDVCEERYDEKFSNDMETFDNGIRNFETAVSSIRQIHVAFDDYFASLVSLDKKPDSQPCVEDDIVNTVKEIRQDLTTVMESSFAANAQRVQTVDAVSQDYHISRQDLNDDEKGPSRLAVS